MASPLFTFLDGAFRYDCDACGQQCCRGKGIAIDAGRELIPLLSRAPAIAPFLDQLPGGYVRLPDVTDGCWFLADDGRCGYETAHGRDAKFTTCRLFPFNRVFQVGQTLVVDYNSVVCPLQDARGSGVTHEELRRELAQAGASALTRSTVPPPPGAENLRWSLLESAIVAASARFLDEPDYLAFATWQDSEARRHFNSAQRSGAPFIDSAQPLADGGRLRRLVSAWAAFYDIGFPELATLGGPSARALCLLTPSLRFNAMFRRGGAPYQAAALQAPRQLLATWFFGALATRVGGRPPSLRGLTELHQAQRGLRELLARFDDRAVLGKEIIAPDAAPELHEALKRAAASLSPRARRRPLWEALDEAAAPLPIVQRPLLLSLLLRAGTELRFEAL